MRLFGYYAWHSVINQLRKVFKTWVLVFILVCALIGGMVGYGAAKLEDAAAPEEDISEIIDDDAVIEEAGMSFEDFAGIEGSAAIELAAGAIILAMCAFQIISADQNGSKIFLPADVNLLFASPMQPQSVLMFRLATQTGTALLGTVYLFFQIPNLVLNAGMSLTGALGLIISWGMTIIVSRLLQTLVYTYTSTVPGTKKYIRTGTYAVIAVLAAAFAAYALLSHEPWLKAADSFFNSPVSRWIPLWGWLKGFCRFSIDGNLPMSLLSAALVILGCVLTSACIYRIKADFYEDAMARSQEVAEMMERINSDTSGRFVFAKRKKDRADSIERDGLHKGWGASVFFHKTMYNRFRFGHLHYFTKTSETYLVIAVCMALLLRFLVNTRSAVPVILAIGVMVFFRTLGNPMAEDTRNEYFRMIPENSYKKLFWSMLAGTANCFLDILPGMIAAVLILQGDVLQMLAGIPLILSVDFYATSISTFLDVSIPSAIGKTIKQVIQIMFIYFGLLPDIAVIAIGITFSHAYLGAAAASLVNLALGAVFFCLIPIWLQPQGGTPPIRQITETESDAKKAFNRCGLALTNMLVMSVAAQTGVLKIAESIRPGIAESETGAWLLTFLPMYLIAVPLALLILKQMPKRKLSEITLPAKYIWILPLICIFIMYAGNILGSVVVMFFASLRPAVEEISPMSLYISTGSVWMRILFVVILAPCIEEFVFRRQLIDRFSLYDEKTAVLISALMFGLFHGNFSQFFYCVGLGLVWGYVYLKTGRLRYTIAMHMFVNFVGGIVGPLLTEYVNASLPSFTEMADMTVSQIMTPQVILYIAYLILLIAMALGGLVLFFTEAAGRQYLTAPEQIPLKKRMKASLLSPGMILFIIATSALFINSIL